jgi:hypothetical protein
MTDASVSSGQPPFAARHPSERQFLDQYSERTDRVYFAGPMEFRLEAGDEVYVDTVSTTT